MANTSGIKPLNLVTLECSLDLALALRTYVRAQGVKAALELLREAFENDAIPHGTADATDESNACYVAMHGLNDVIDDVESV